MRMLILAGAAALCIGVIGANSASAAPANATVIGAAAETSSPVTKAFCRVHRWCEHGRCWVHRHCW
jgi:hypothetical protein